MGILIPFADSEITITEKKSVFIACVRRVQSESEARKHIDEVSKRHFSASHVVYAYDIKEENAARYSDAGEPKGTAGLPVFEVFRREGLTNYCCTVTRYFGGILLGASGLTRAYAASAQAALKAAEIAELCAYLIVSVRCEYRHLDKIKAFLNGYEHEIRDIGYTEIVELNISIPEETFFSVKDGITELASGDVEVETKGRIFLPRKKSQN